jgi:hypothetical protein
MIVVGWVGEVCYVGVLWPFDTRCKVALQQSDQVWGAATDMTQGGSSLMSDVCRLGLGQSGVWVWAWF